MRVLLGMSGGLDSSYAALKLIEEGHDLEGACLVMHDYTDTDSAMAAAKKLGIPLHVIDCRARFSEIVEKNLVSEYMAGRTPNPCVLCNPTVKFASLLSYADTHGFDCIATGHYARVEKVTENGESYHRILRASDVAKDQSYMLYRLGEEVLSRLILPLGGERKADIRERIKTTEFASFDKRDSQEICFIPDGDYVSYVESRAGRSAPGDFVDADGKYVGRHKGIIRYTIGQRKGLGISLGERAFVTDIDALSNTVTVSTEPAASKTVVIRDTVFARVPKSGFVCSVKVRYAARPVEAIASLEDDGRIVLELAEAQRSVTPGQSAVLYDGDAVIGGGVICK